MFGLSPNDIIFCNLGNKPRFVVNITDKSVIRYIVQLIVKNKKLLSAHQLEQFNDFIKKYSSYLRD